MQETIKQQKAIRLEHANTLLRMIANTGRRFFYHDGNYGHLSVTASGTVRWEDAFEGSSFVARLPFWNGFTEGGTLKSLVMALGKYVKDGTLLSSHHLGPWPEWICGGDLWGYGEEIKAVRNEALSLGIVDFVEAHRRIATMQAAGINVVM